LKIAEHVMALPRRKQTDPAGTSPPASPQVAADSFTSRVAGLEIEMFSCLSQTRPAGLRRRPFTLSFTTRLLFTPASEKALLDGCEHLYHARFWQGLVTLRKSTSLADGAYLAGFAALATEQLVEACRYFRAALAKQKSLGRTFQKYQINATILLPIGDEISAPVGPDSRSVLLGLVKATQRLKRSQETASYLELARQTYPDDVLVKVVTAELLLEKATADRNVCAEVVRLSEGTKLDSPLHAGLLLYRARAMRHLGMLSQTNDLLAAVVNHARELPLPLLLGLQYERALTFEQLGNRDAAVEQLKEIHRRAPTFKDVAIRLKLTGHQPDGGRAA
jgi:tetratricopeptide (TPR) repeat protein